MHLASRRPGVSRVGGVSSICHRVDVDFVNTASMDCIQIYERVYGGYIRMIELPGRLASMRKRAKRSGSLCRDWGRTLIATRRFNPVSRARYTP